jgi:regulator of sigma E protease
MDVLVMVAQVLLSLTILVGLHEWGHFYAARKFGIRVNKFYIFFDFLFPLPNVLNFALWKRKKGDTEYGLGWFPLGGYVDIAGMVDETKDAKSLSEIPEDWEFRAKPAWQRLLVMLGGIIVNIVIGVLVFIGVTYKWGEEFTPINEINKDGIVAYDIAKKIGFETGDKILKVNGNDVKYYEELLDADVLLGQNVSFTIERGGQQKTISIPDTLANSLSKQRREGRLRGFIGTKDKFAVGAIAEQPSKSLVTKIKELFTEAKPDSVMPAAAAGIKPNDNILAVNGQPITYFYEFSEKLQENKSKSVDLTVLRGKDTLNLKSMVSHKGQIGISTKMPTKRDSVLIEYSLLGSITKGTSKAFKTITDNIKGFKKIFKGDVDFENAVSGPIAIGKLFGDEWDWRRFWGLTGMLSMVLAFMNALPIPALDGGHALLLLYEMISGRKPSEKFQERFQQVGMIILLSLMVFVFYNDLR